MIDQHDGRHAEQEIEGQQADVAITPVGDSPEDARQIEQGKGDGRSAVDGKTAGIVEYAVQRKPGSVAGEGPGVIEKRGQLAGAHEPAGQQQGQNAEE